MFNGIFFELTTLHIPILGLVSIIGADVTIFLFPEYFIRDNSRAS